MKNEQNLSTGAQVWRLPSESGLGGAAEGPRGILFREKKIITCTISESWRGEGFETRRALQIAINTLNYPASLKAFALPLFPARKQAPDCGRSEWNIQEGVEPAGQEAGEGGQGKSSVPRKARPSWMAGHRAGDCAGLCSGRSACV